LYFRFSPASFDRFINFTSLSLGFVHIENFDVLGVSFSFPLITVRSMKRTVVSPRTLSLEEHIFGASGLASIGVADSGA
jgi:hypothetical protein